MISSNKIHIHATPSPKLLLYQNGKTLYPIGKKNDAGCVSLKMHNFCNNSWDIISNGIYFHNNSGHSFLKSAAEWKKYLHKITYNKLKTGTFVHTAHT